MKTPEEIEAMMEDLKQHTVSGVFELHEKSMETLRELYDNYSQVMCPTQSTTFEQFCGLMMVAGANHVQKEIVKELLKHMYDKIIN